MRRYKKDQLRKIGLYFILDSKKRTKYLIKHNVFASVGKNFFFQPRKIPEIGRACRVSDFMLNNMGLPRFYKYQSGCIEVKNNVFIGSNTIILPNVRIGNNVMIGAGSVVTKDVPDNSVVVGNPARVIESFDEYLEKRNKKEENMIEYVDKESRNKLWKQFYKNRGE